MATIYTKYIVEGDEETLLRLFDTFHTHSEAIKPYSDSIGNYLQLLGYDPDAMPAHDGDWMSFSLDCSIGRPLLLFLEESKNEPTRIFDHLAELPPLKGHIYAIHSRSDNWEEDTHEFNDNDLREEIGGNKLEVLDDNEIFRQFLHLWLGRKASLKLITIQ